jgi:cellulose synthase/poly-beta-1,6-N-acetylglucosamine synthase-like glycosyltransferase
MGIGVGGAAVARFLEIHGEGARSSADFSRQKFVRPQADATDNFPELVCIRQPVATVAPAPERRAVGLGDSINDVLIAAGTHASEQLKRKWPRLSAATLHPVTKTIPLLLAAFALVAIFTTPGMIVLSIIVALPTAFRIWVWAHSVTASADPPLRPPLPLAPDEEWPQYSVIVPLRGEAVLVDQLLSAIERLDYPAEKLDVILAVEADDHDTRAAITAREHRFPIMVIPIPEARLRTKPKALNVALPFARGAFTVIFDAEDRPERDQLHRALQAFRLAGSDLACVQARLCMDTKTSWLARYFTAEYAGHFDIFLPRLAALGLPLPLGGSSNHFRTSALREAGGWDAYNVTEDADLGMRLCRFGYRSGVIDSTTFEEAPVKLLGWLGQRRRWFKGWMQTWLVHMREPRRLFRELGCGGFLTFQLIVGGNALVALAHPAFLFGLIWELILSISAGDHQAAVARLEYYTEVAAFGYCASASFGLLGLWRRNSLNRASVLILTPVHWLLLSLAAWWAAIELITKPYFWEKTEHGLDKLPRLDRATRSLLELERHLTELKQSGRLPEIWSEPKGNAANQQPHLEASA